MSRIFALADLHLSLSGAKPMHVFGEAWRDHPKRMAEAWDRTVLPDDTILLPGDLSWALRLEEAAPDLEWIGRRPGTKILLRGNHDYWWSSAARVRAALPGGCLLLQNNSFLAAGHVVVGARGWLSPADPTADSRDEKIFLRELDRLRLSVADADRRFGRELPRVAMLHYPPWIEGREPTELVSILREAGVSLCVYGHLHGADHALAVTGDRNGVAYHLVAADAVGFSPRLVVGTAKVEAGPETAE